VVTVKRYDIDVKLVLFTIRKSHRLVSESMTLNDLEGLKDVMTSNAR